MSKITAALRRFLFVGLFILGPVVLFGCARTLQMETGLKDGGAGSAAALGVQGTSAITILPPCLAQKEVSGAEKEEALKQALADPQVEQLRQDLKTRVRFMSLQEAKVFAMGARLLVLIPFKPDALLSYGSSPNGTFVLASIVVGEGHTNTIRPNRPERPLFNFEGKDLLKHLRINPEFQAWERDLQNLGWELDPVPLVIADKATQKAVIIMLALRNGVVQGVYVLAGKVSNLPGPVSVEVSRFRPVQLGCGLSSLTVSAGKLIPTFEETWASEAQTQFGEPCWPSTCEPLLDGEGGTDTSASPRCIRVCYWWGCITVCRPG